jgi:flagellar basal-body rod modification protein FlgD
MAVSATSSITSPYTVPENNPNRASLDQTGFIKLLVTQLATQDPLSPMDNKDMAQQLVQLTQIQSITQMQTSMQKLQAASLIGKQVDGTDTNGISVSGIVTSLKLSGDNISVMVGAQSIDITAITSVSEGISK